MARRQRREQRSPAEDKAWIRKYLKPGKGIMHRHGQRWTRFEVAHCAANGGVPLVYWVGHPTRPVRVATLLSARTNYLAECEYDAMVAAEAEAATGKGPRRAPVHALDPARFRVLEKRLTSLEAHNAMLQSRVEELERRAGLAPSAPPPPPPFALTPEDAGR